MELSWEEAAAADDRQQQRQRVTQGITDEGYEQR